MDLRINAAACSSIGGRRNNEDNFFLNGVYMSREQMDQGALHQAGCGDPVQIYAVCDGMGGAMYGDEASCMAVAGLAEFRSKCDQADDPVSIEAMLARISDDINRMSVGRDQSEGSSGSTIAMLVLRDGYFRAIHVGDSRIYRLQNGRLEQLTKDHSLVQRLVDYGEIKPEDAFQHPMKHYITQHLGMSVKAGAMKPDISPRMKLQPGDRFLICSDGLSDVTPDDMIARVLGEAESAQACAPALVKCASAEAKRLDIAADNITVVVLDVLEAKDDSGMDRQIGRLKRARGILFGCLAAMAACAAWFAYDLVRLLMR